MSGTAKAPPAVVQELGKLANSRLLSEFSRSAGVSLSTLVNVKNGKPITEETLQTIVRGIAQRRSTLVPSVSIQFPTLHASGTPDFGAVMDPISRTRLHAGVVHLVTQLSELLQENTQLRSQLTQANQQHTELQRKVQELEAVLSRTSTPPVEALEPVAALAAVAEVAGPQHNTLMEQLRARLPKVPATS